MDSVRSESRRTNGPAILVIDDHVDIRRILEQVLGGAGFSVAAVGDADEGLRLIAERKFDLIVLDILLPGGMDGFEVCRRIRSDASHAHTPIIMLTAKSEDKDAVQGLETGADDYIKKPFSPIEVVARVRALLRRATTGPDAEAAQVVACGGLVLDSKRHVATIDGNVVGLTLAEFRLLHFLMANAERAFSRQELLPHVVGANVRVVDRNIDVHVRNVRKKIGNYADRIVTVRGIGYRFAMDGSDVLNGQ